MKSDDWGDSIDDMESGDWEDYLGGPDDDVLERIASEEYKMEELIFNQMDDENVEQIHNNKFFVTRQQKIVTWLESSTLAIKFKNGKGFFVPKGPLVRLANGTIIDLLEWLQKEGIKETRTIAGYNIVHTKPESKYGEKLSFFKIVIDAPFTQ